MLKQKTWWARTDWVLLHAQKTTLIELIAAENSNPEHTMSEAQKEHLEGLVSFLDILSDYAEDVLEVYKHPDNSNAHGVNLAVADGL